MNAIEREIVKRAKRLIIEAAREELQRIKSELENKKNSTLFDVLNTGILIDVDKLKKHGLNQLEKRFLTIGKREGKNKKNTD